jgi:hypothetical protein
MWIKLRGSTGHRRFEDSEIRSVVLRNLIDDLAAIEALAQQLKPDHSRLRRMLTRLAKGLKDAAVPVAARIAEAYLKERRVVIVGRAKPR